MSMIGDIRKNKARKRHCCAYCAESILPGEMQRSWCWKDGRELQSVHVHEECNDPCDDYCRESDDQLCPDGSEVTRGVYAPLDGLIRCATCGKSQDDHQWKWDSKPETECRFERPTLPELLAWVAVEWPLEQARENVRAAEVLARQLERQNRHAAVLFGGES